MMLGLYYIISRLFFFFFVTFILLKIIFFYMLVNYFLKKRKKRKMILFGVGRFFIGDIISISYRLNGLGFSFTGICIAIRKKSLLTTNSSIVIKNIFNKVSVEISIIINCICRIVVSFLDFSRKSFFYRKSKLYYLSKKANISSFVKSR